MKSMCAMTAGAAFVMLSGMAALGQTTPATQGQSQSQPQTRTDADTSAEQRASAGERVTIIGCVVGESEYRQARGLERGGVAGTGIAAANEFVLVSASMAGGERADANEAQEGRPVGTSGNAEAAEFELSGPAEGDAAQFAGQRVEIVGMLEGAGSAGGPTAGAPPEGVDVVSEDLRIREIEVTSVRAAEGSCEPMR